MDELLRAIASQAGVAILVLMVVVLGLIAVLRYGMDQWTKQGERYAIAIDKITEALTQLRITIAERRP